MPTFQRTDQAEKLILKGYGEEVKSLTELRTSKCLGQTSGILQKLPPTLDAFQQHLKRVSLATLIMKSAHISMMPHVQFDEYGWSVDTKGAVTPVMMTENPLPDKLRQSVRCSCKKEVLWKLRVYEAERSFLHCLPLSRERRSVYAGSR